MSNEQYHGQKPTMVEICHGGNLLGNHDGSVGDNQKAFGNRDHTDEECSRTLGGCIFASVY